MLELSQGVNSVFKKIRRISNYTIKIACLVAFLFACTQVGLVKAETSTTNTNLNKTLDLSAMAIKVQELRRVHLFSPIDTYIGSLTAYAADCPLCGGKLGCTGQNVLTPYRITHHHDHQFGNVRIVASSRSLPCGSIIQFDLPSVSDQRIVAIVLDRGVLGTDIDLLMYSAEEALSQVGRRQISYDILRFGY